MDLIFPYRKNKNKIEIYFKDNSGDTIIKNNKYTKKIIGFNKNYIKEIYEKNSLFSGYEDYIINNIAKKLLNKKSMFMGILNATPDSFYEKSRIINNKIIDNMISQKPDIIDIGGESTRPGSSIINPDEEFNRIKPVIEYVKSVSKIPVSIDSRNPETIEKCLKYDIDYINDISGFKNNKMIKIASENNIKNIVMHMIGTPQTMNNYNNYDDIIFEINEFFYKKINEMLENNIKPENIIIDPGIGFSKDLKGNIDIIKSPWSFFIGFDTLFGTSMKSFIGKITGSDTNNRSGGTIATSIYLNNNGVDILRLHDIKDNRDAINVYNYIKNSLIND